MAFSELAGRYGIMALGVIAGTALCIVGVIVPGGQVLVPIGAAVLGAGVGARIPDGPGNRFQ